MGIRDNGVGGSGGGSGGGSISGENVDVWGGFIVEGYKSVGSVVASLVVHIVGIYSSVTVFVSVNVFEFSDASTSNVFFQKQKTKYPGGGGNF